MREDSSEDLSVVRDVGTYESSCGYCNSCVDSRSHGMHALALTVQDYQDLIDQGWRRSGTFLYKPDNQTTCCRQYTIRLCAPDFKPSRAQRRLLHRWDEFLAGTYEFPGRGGGGSSNDSPAQTAAALPGATAAAAAAPPPPPPPAASAAAAAAARPPPPAGTAAPSAGTLTTAAAAARGTAGPCAQQGSTSASQPRRDVEAAKPADAAATADTDAGAGVREQSAPSSGGGGTVALDALRHLLAAAIAAVLQSAPLNSMQLLPPQPAVTALTGKQARLAPAGAAFCSPAAFPLTAAARKAGISVSAPEVAQQLAAAFNAAAAAAAGGAGAASALAGGAAGGSSWQAAHAPTGHLNFIGPAVPSASAEAQQPRRRRAQQGQQQQQQQQLPQQPPPVQRQESIEPGAEGGPHQHAQQQRAQGTQQQPLRQQQQQQQKQKQQPSHRQHTFEVRTLPSQFLEEEYQLYCRYQVAQHGDDADELSRAAYKRFLVDSPLQHQAAAAPPAPPPPPAAAPAASAVGYGPAAAAAPAASSGGRAAGRGGGCAPRQGPRPPEGGVLAAARAAALQPAAAGPPGVGGPEDSSDEDRPAPACAGAAAPAAAAAGVPACGYGSFHQQYWLDGKLVAVAVVDVLPRCLSSKYFFWDPDLRHLSLGRLSALLEIEWVRAVHGRGAGALAYYYMGYYIHTCPKMRYKAEYQRSELLCPQRLAWVAIDRTVREALDRRPYVVLSALPGVTAAPSLVPGLAQWLAASRSAATAAASAAAAAPPPPAPVAAATTAPVPAAAAAAAAAALPAGAQPASAVATQPHAAAAAPSLETDGITGCDARESMQQQQQQEGWAGEESLEADSDVSMSSWDSMDQVDDGWASDGKGSASPRMAAPAAGALSPAAAGGEGEEPTAAPALAAPEQLLLLQNSTAVSWSVLRDALKPYARDALQRRLAEWQQAVGPTSRRLLYQLHLSAPHLLQP